MSSVPTSAPDRPLGRVAVLGLGLIGGSVARGVSGLGLASKVTGWSPLSTERDAALTVGAVTFATADRTAAVADADLVVLATPLEAARRLLSEVAETAPERCTVTDVASLKAPLAAAATAAGLTGRWVGSHPMAGSEASGFWASRADLFQGARVWTVAVDPDPGHERIVHRLWKGLGAQPVPIEAEEHDRLMAVVSHLPQLVANALARVLEGAGARPEQLGPGGRDMTRLAASSPEMWRDLIEHASPTLVDGLRSVGDAAQEIADHLERGDVDAIDALMRRTGAWRGRR